MATTLLVPKGEAIVAKGKGPEAKRSRAGQHEATLPMVTEPEIYYPESDEEPMAETGIHVHAMLCLYGWLYAIFHRTPDIWVAANIFMYYKKGDPRRRKAPDVMVVKGVENRFRRTFKTWEENAVPAVIFEFTSKGTIDEDTVIKSSLYAPDA
ncbi:MAG: Uma2 family endonuclease [Caldilineaceae bacterium]